jgi:tetratricopeptide (TPR) repeat protein
MVLPQEDHVGGLDTRDMVAVDLAATADLLREGSYTEATGRRLLSAVSELCQIAGWIASDAGRHDEARNLYLAGARAAHAAGDAPGAASNLSSLAYQIANVGDPREAVLLARSAYRGAEHEATAATRALLLERVAWAHARAGEADPAQRALDLVDDTYAGRRHGAEEDPIWVYWLNAEEIEVMAGRVWTQLRRPLRAAPALEHAIAAYRDDAPREVALYLTWLAEALAEGGEVDRAGEVALRALRLAKGAGSVQATERVEGLRRRLAPHRRQPAVDAFLDEAREGPTPVTADDQ